MFPEKSVLSRKCPICGNEIVINVVCYPGGCNDYGYFEVECEKCEHHFEIYVGRDVDASSIKSGAKLISKKYKD